MARGIGEKEGQYNQNDIVEADTAHFFDISNEKTACRRDRLRSDSKHIYPQSEIPF